MRILIFTENFYCGGLDTFIITLINNWPIGNDEITLVCNKSHPGLKVIARGIRRPCQIISHNYPLSSYSSGIPHSNLNRVLGYPFRLLRRWFLFARYLNLLSNLFDQLEAHRLLVVNGGYPGGLTCRAASVAWGRSQRRPLCIHNFHNYSQKIRWFESPVENYIDRQVHRYSKAIVSVSASCKDSIVNRSAFSDSDRLKYIHNGIENRFSQATANEVRSSLGITNDAPLCLMLGTYESRKGHEFLLDSFVEVVKHIPSARLIICGFGYPAEVERVREAVKSRDLGHNALLEGFREDVPCLIAASMVVVVPSQSNESFGLTIVEAMSHGVPVIATAIGGIPEILVNGRGGYLVAPNDVLGMAELIKQLLSNRALREEQGRYGKQCFEENFRAEKMARKYAKLLRPSSTNI